MQRIINTLKNGTPKAKRIVVFFVLAGIVSIGFVITAIVFKQLVFFFGAVIGVFVIISLLQTLEVFEYKNELLMDEIMPDSAPEYAKTGTEETLYNESEDIESGQTEAEYADTDDDYDAILAKMDNVLANAEAVQAEYGAYEYEGDDEHNITVAEDDEDAGLFRTKRKKSKNNKSRKRRSKDKAAKKQRKIKLAKRIKKSDSNPEKTEVTEKSNNDFEEALEKDVAAYERAEQKKLVVIKQASDEELATYNKKKIKKTLHKYKVKRDHRLILIDRCKKYDINQTPAYVWVTGNEFNILLIEEEPRHLVIPLFGIKEITYLKKQEVNADTDYPAFHKKNMITDLFRPYLPDYTQSTVATDLASYKNLYGIGNDIFVTNRSAKNLFDLLGVDFRVDDKVTTSSKVNNYFKESYKAGILLRDNVIDANGYADKISNILDNMAKSSMSYNEFKDTLNLMIKNKIITNEFAMHYMDVRDKIRK